MAMAVAHLRITPEAFFLMRPPQFYGALEIWADHERSTQRFNAELLRLQTTALLNIQLKKKDRIKPGELWRFPWDDEGAEVEKLEDDDAIRRHNEEILKRFSKNG